ncbi:MAG: DUF3352 domain-containing protein [Geitlerinemataceae cyanobacterium]
MFGKPVNSIVCVLTLFCGAAVAQPIDPPKPASPPAVSQVLPANIAGAFFANTTDVWGDLERFNPLPFPISSPGSIPFLPMETDFQTDIQPWVGEWAAVVLLAAADSTVATTPTLWNNHLLAIVPVSDKAGMTAYLETVKELRGKDPIERSVGGATLWEWEAEEIPFPEILPEILPEMPQEMPESEELNNPVTQFLTKAWNMGLKNQIAQAKPKFPPVYPLPPLSPEESPVLEPFPETVPEPFPESFPEQSEPFPNEPFPFPLQRPGLAIAVFDNYLAVSTTSAALEQLITAQTTLVPLANNPDFQRTVNHPEFGRSMVALYANTKQLANLAANLESPSFPQPPGSPINSPMNFWATLLEPLAEQYTTLEGWGWAEETGFRSQGRAHYRTPQPDFATPDSMEPAQILARIPGNSYMSANSRNLARQWQRVVESAQQDPQRQFVFDEFRRVVRENLDLDLEEDIISLFDGEYASFLFPTTKGLIPFNSPGFNIGVGVAVGTSDRPGMERLLALIEDKISSVANGEVEMTSTQVGNLPMTSWEVPLGDGTTFSGLAYGWVDSDTLLITTGREPMAQLVPQPYGNLTESYTFQTAIEPFPKPNSGYFFLNAGSLFSFINGFIPPELSQNPAAAPIRQLLGSIRSLGVSSFSTPEWEQSDFHLVLSPVRQKLTIETETP